MSTSPTFSPELISHLREAIEDGDSWYIAQHPHLFREAERMVRDGHSPEAIAAEAASLFSFDDGDVFADYANASSSATAQALLTLCADLSEDAYFGLKDAISEALENARDDSAEDEDLPFLLADLES